ncbi:MAG: hypothetical protein ACP5HU_08390 [Phycisphaerae bacterium]
MAWKKNRKLVAEGLSDLAYLPKGRCGWDATLSSWAYAVRPELVGWAARHGLAVSGRAEEFGPDALVLWHGTTRERAEKIREHGLFSKRGLWATTSPLVAHGYTRGRGERYGDGAMVCIVCHAGDLQEGRNYTLSGRHGSIYQFHHGLPAHVLEYVLVSEGIEFTGTRRAARPAPWRSAQFRKRQGQWVPVQQPPVRFSDDADFSTLEEFVQLTLERMLGELGKVCAVEVFSTLYALVSPREALRHEDILGWLEDRCLPAGRIGRWQTFTAR